LEEVMNEESNGNNQNDEAMKVSRCGDGRLELASGTTSLGDGVQTSLVGFVATLCLGLRGELE
jgi:hypothetical protein